MENLIIIENHYQGFWVNTQRANVEKIDIAMNSGFLDVKNILRIL